MESEHNPNIEPQNGGVNKEQPAINLSSPKEKKKTNKTANKNTLQSQGQREE